MNCVCVCVCVYRYDGRTNYAHTIAVNEHERRDHCTLRGQSTNRVYCELDNWGVKPICTRRFFFFSHFYDLTFFFVPNVHFVLLDLRSDELSSSARAGRLAGKDEMDIITHIIIDVCDQKRLKSTLDLERGSFFFRHVLAYPFIWYN